MNGHWSQSLDQTKAAEYCQLYYEAVYRYIAYRIPSKEDSEDVASDVFLRALKSNCDTPASVLGWLYKIAENLIIDFYRKRGTRQRIIQDRDEDEMPDAPANNADHDLNMDLTAALGSLSGEHYQVVMMRFIEGYSIEEVAAAIGRSEGATKALQFRALTKLRGILREEEHAKS